MREMNARVDQLTYFLDSERSLRRRLALGCWGRLQNQIDLRHSPPTERFLDWAVDEINELVSTIEQPGSPDAEYELELLLNQLLDRLRPARS